MSARERKRCDSTGVRRGTRGRRGAALALRPAEGTSGEVHCSFFCLQPLVPFSILQEYRGQQWTEEAQTGQIRS